MTNFQELWERRISDVYEEYFKCAREAEAARPREYRACVAIQAFYRGYSVRKSLSFQIAAALNIQRVFRGHVARLIYEQRLREKERRERMAFFDRNATIIQKIWRGYYSRKNVHSYYKRKAYILSVVQKGEELLARRKQQQEVLEEELQQEKFNMMESKFRDEASKHHFMISTRAIPGVFNSTKIAGTADLEYYLRSNRNISSPSKSPPQETQQGATLPAITTRRTDTAQTKPVSRASNNSPKKVSPLPALNTSLSSKKKRAAT